MQLKIRRSQKAKGITGKKVAFCLDATVDLSNEEAADVEKYKLGDDIVYSSDSAKKHIDKAGSYAAGMGGSFASALYSSVAARLSLIVSINDLTSGKHIECESLEELLGAEEAVMSACRNLKSYLDTARTFDGREEIINFDAESAA